MSFQETTATRKISALRKRIRAIQGGTSASKTISILLYLIAMSQTDRVPKLTSVVSESFPHLKRGAIRDFLNIMQEHGYFQEARWNRTDSIYTFETGSKIEFFSADQPEKVRGPRRDRLFINEANNVPYQTFDQLEVRTREFIFLDWNPTTEFWYYDQVAQRNDVDHLIITYQDNEGLEPAVVASIEQRKGNKEWWQVYGMGLLGEVETRVYKGWRVVDEVPFEARLEKLGMDFGYTNDPTAIIAVYYHDGGYVLDELVYQTGLSNKNIADLIKDQEFKVTTVADAAEPKSIDEIRLNGVTILPAKKGPGSVLQGIQYVQQQKVSMTKRSVNLIKEYRNYVWVTDKEGVIINEPLGINDHAMDAVRYAFSLIRPQERQTAHTYIPQSSQPRNNLPGAETPKVAHSYIPRL